MKPAKEWSQEFCNKYIINARQGDPVRELVEAVQKDALRYMQEKCVPNLLSNL